MCHRHKHSICGLTLVELMIAMLLGIIMIGGTIQIFIGSKASYNTGKEMGIIQENARYALDLLAKKVRVTGYMGCVGQAISGMSTQDIVKPAFKPTGDDYFDKPVLGYDGQSDSGDDRSDWLPNLPNYFGSGQVIAGSDVITIQQALPFSSAQIGHLHVTSSSLKIDTNPADNPIIPGDTLLLSDCENTHIFMVSDVTNSASTVTITYDNTLNSSTLSTTYGVNTQLMRVTMNSYYIGTNADNHRALFRATLASKGSMTTQELVEGVETMQIAYGEDLDDDGLPNRYVAADDISDNDDIVTVRIGLLLYTTKEIASENESRTFNVAGTDVGSTSTIPTHQADKALRQLYSTTIKLRNRGMN